jgi:hypothetical protein
MTDHHTYGTCTHSADELVRLVSGRLGLVFTERESDYRGVYHLADSPDGRIESSSPIRSLATTAKTTSTSRNARRRECSC